MHRSAGRIIENYAIKREWAYRDQHDSRERSATAPDQVRSALSRYRGERFRKTADHLQRIDERYSSARDWWTSHALGLAQDLQDERWGRSMKTPFANRHPVILSVIYFVLLSLFPAAATIIASTVGLSPVETSLVQAGAFSLSILLAFVLMVKSPYTLREYGVGGFQQLDTAVVLWFAPLILVEATVIMVLISVGFDSSITPAWLAVLALLMTAAAVNEEIYFRGLILRTLSAKSISLAIILSSVMFGLAHLGSLTAGRGLGHALLLVFFSALFGFVCAEIVIITRSLLAPIVWHLAHNILSSVTAEASYGATLAIVGFQCLVLLVYAIHLWKGIEERKHALLGS